MQVEKQTTPDSDEYLRFEVTEGFEQGTHLQYLQHRELCTALRKVLLTHRNLNSDSNRSPDDKQKGSRGLTFK